MKKMICIFITGNSDFGQGVNVDEHKCLWPYNSFILSYWLTGGQRCIRDTDTQWCNTSKSIWSYRKHDKNTAL